MSQAVPDPTPNPATSGDWIFEHVLALLSIGSCVYLYWLMAVFDIETLLQPQKLPSGLILAGTICTLAAILFWVRMFTDFFKHRPASHVAAWGWFLLIGAQVAALVYFVRVWRPRQRR